MTQPPKNNPVAKHAPEFCKPKTFRDRHKEHKLGEDKWKHNKADPYVRKPVNKQEMYEALDELEDLDG